MQPLFLCPAVIRIPATQPGLQPASPEITDIVNDCGF